VDLALDPFPHNLRELLDKSPGLNRVPWLTDERLHEAKVSVFIQNLGIYSLQADGTVNPLASIIITVLAEFSNIERSNIQYRLNSGRAQYVAAGGKLGRKEGYRKSDEEMREQYKNAIALLKKGYSVRAVAKLEGISHTTVQKLKNKFI